VDDIDSKVEFLHYNYSMRERVEMWNMQASKFFRLYFYNRFLQVCHNKGMAMGFVMLANAVWHGVYISYLWSVCLMGLFIQMSKCFFKVYRNTGINEIEKRWYSLYFVMLFFSNFS